jgi:hypothetical protein
MVSLLSLGSAASALTLDELANGGQSFVSGNGALTFGEFDVTASSGLDPDLTKYTIEVIDDGFELRGPINAADGEQDDLFVAYSVTGSSAITGASLFFNGQTLPAVPGVAASVAEDFLDGANVLGSLFVARTGGGLDQPSATLQLASPTASLRVEKDILVDSRFDQIPDSTAAIASISLVRQQFEVAVIPEPTTVLMLGAGLAGLAVAGRARRA